MRKLLSVVMIHGIVLGGPAMVQAAAGDSPPLLLRYPTVSRTQIAFNYAGDLWIVAREGGEARQLTSGAGVETVPHFSPDGATIAFTGEYDGNRDVYVVAATGGVPRRLTFHPADDIALGWTPDGTRVLFTSSANAGQSGEMQLYTVALDGSLPSALPLPTGAEAALAPDGAHIAYVPHIQWQSAWKRYRGGQTTPIWLADLKDSSIVKVPRENSNDHSPMWVGDTVYFLSDRSGPVSLFAYDTKTHAVTQALASDGFDFKTASSGPDAIVIEQFGAIKLYDLATHQTHNVAIHVSADVASVRAHFAKVDPKRIRNWGISPTGVRAVFEAWGEIFTVPTDKGDIRNLTRSPAVAERDPAWSPDGKSIAYFSDASGEYELNIRDQAGLGEVRSISLGEPSFYYAPAWSPDSKRIAYEDKHVGLWYVELASGARKRIDEQYYSGFGNDSFEKSWSPDSQWLAYSRILRSGLRAIYLYSIAQDRTFQVTDGLSDATAPAFDRNGKYLYFMASTDTGLTTQVLDMTSDEHRVVRSVYAVVLSKEEPSPVAPESDEDKGASDAGPATAEASHAPAGKSAATQDRRDAAAAANKDGTKRPGPTRIDIEGIGQRIVALPIPSRNYFDLRPGKPGILFLAEGPPVLPAVNQGDPPAVLQKFDLSKRKVDKLIDELDAYTVSFDGSRILYRKGSEWLTASADEPASAGAPAKPGIGPLKLEGWQVYVEPRAMWKQMWDETWRIERDFFYDPHFHGLDLAKAKARYAPYVAGLASRDELTYLMDESLGEITVGHMFVRGGDRPEVAHVNVGMLGADYALEGGRYRIARIYNGENWNPQLQAPLTQPGVNVQSGEYLLAVNSRELRASDNVYDFMQGLAGKQVALRVGPRADGTGSRTVTVVPVENEYMLRHLARIEDNRRRVDEASGGRVAYIYLPNTAGEGFTSFNRYFFSQVGKDAVIIDERFNGGGQLADYIIDYLRRPLMSRMVGRDGHERSSPSEAIYGPKVMLVNEMAGSGGDALPWYFRKAGLGTLVGKRTWGGLVGIGGYPELLDGGLVTAPRVAIYGLNGDWEVENRGIAPDVEVDLDPAAARGGRDSQLEKAIEVVLQQLKEHPAPQFVHPPYPNYHQRDGLGATQ